jgi:hypothetical protein
MLMTKKKREKLQVGLYLIGKTTWQLRRYKFFGPFDPNKKTISYGGSTEALHPTLDPVLQIKA